MSLLSYKDFLNESSQKELDDKFDPADIIKSIETFAKQIKVEQKKSVFNVLVYLTDRDSQTAQVDNFLKTQGFEIEKVQTSKSSAPVTEFELDGYLMRLIFKPIGGGQQMTTLNSTITELVPILLWKANYTGGPDPQSMLETCKSVDLSKITWAGGSDQKAAADYIEMFETSSLFGEKMENAFAIYKWLLSQNPTDLIWAYRTKPEGVPDKSRADIVVRTKDDYFGVSVKAKSQSSSKVRKMSTTFFEALRFFGQKYVNEARSFAWNNVFSGMIQQYISENPDSEKVMKTITESNCWDLSGATQKIDKNLLTVIDYLYKKNPKAVDETGYYKLQEGARSIILSMIKNEPDNWVEFIKDKSGIKTVFPVKVVVALKTTATEILDDTEESIAAILDQTPVVGEIIASNKKGLNVMYGNKKYTYEVRNNSGGNKTAVVYRMPIDQVG